MFPDDIFPFIIAIVIFLIPIVAILTKHQQKMAEILHSRRGEKNMEVDALRSEIHELKSLLLQQAIAIDDVRRSEKTEVDPATVRDRLSGGLG